MDNPDSLSTFWRQVGKQNMKNNSRLNFTMLVFFILLAVALAIFAYLSGGVDFGVYYAAGRVYLQGGNPYSFSQLSRQIVSSTGKLNNPFYYAPWFLWAMLPFSILPYSIARIFWAVINFALWIFGLFNLGKLIDYPQKGWKRWGVYTFCTFVFAWSTWGSEQVGILIFLLLTFVLISFENKKWLSMGFWMALLLFKPNITAFPLLALSVWLIYRGTRKPVMIMAGILVLMTTISLLISPGWYLELLRPDKISGLSYTLSETGATQIIRYKTTLKDWLAVYGIIGTMANAIYSIVIITGIIFTVQAIYESRSIVKLTAFLFLVNFALLPYALFYDYPSLIFTLFFINFELAEKPSLIWIQRAMNILVFLSLFIGNSIAYRYWIVVVLMVTMIIKNFCFAHINSSPKDGFEVG
jgi:hypothetical protein